MDLGAMTERLTSAATAVAEPTAPSEPASTPVAESTPASSAVETPTTSVEVPDLNFEDDPDELNFDDESAQAAAPVAPATPEVPKPEFEGMLPKDVENAFLHTNRGKRMLATFKAQRSLEQAPSIDPATGANTGGLGFMPTPEQIKEFHAAHSDWNAAQHEFQANPESWAVNNFLSDGNLREGATEVLASIPRVLIDTYNRASQAGDPLAQEASVSAFNSVFRPMAVEYIDGLYARAGRIADPAQRETYLNAARTVEFDLTGKFRGDEQLAPPKPEDALAQREQAIRTEEEKLRSWQMKNQSEQAKQAQSQVFGDVDKALTGYIDKAFATANLQATMTPFAYKAAVAAYKAQVQQAVRQDQFAWRQYNFALSKVNGSPRSADAQRDAVKAYAQAAQQAIKNTYRNILKDLVGGTVAQNAAVRSIAANGASQTGPAGKGGQPVSQSVIDQPKLSRMPGEDSSDYAKRRLMGALGQAAS